MSAQSTDHSTNKRPADGQPLAVQKSARVAASTAPVSQSVSRPTPTIPASVTQAIGHTLGKPLNLGGQSTLNSTTINNIRSSLGSGLYNQNLPPLPTPQLHQTAFSKLSQPPASTPIPLAASAPTAAAPPPPAPAPPPVAAKPSPKGFVLSGSWILDKQRSDSMKPYLELMGLSDMAIEAWTKAEKETDTLKSLELSGVDCRITKRSRVQNTTETYQFGQEVVTNSKVEGQKKRVLVSSDHAAHLVVKSQLPLKNGAMCSLQDTMTVEEGPDLLKQELVAENVKTKAQATILRYYSRTEALPEVDAEEEDEE